MKAVVAASFTQPFGRDWQLVDFPDDTTPRVGGE